MKIPLFNTPIMEKVKYLEAKSRVDDRRIAELEKEVKHLNQVAYNTSKVSFEAGACCPYVDFHEHAILFAKKITKEQGNE